MFAGRYASRKDRVRYSAIREDARAQFSGRGLCIRDVCSGNRCRASFPLLGIGRCNTCRTFGSYSSGARTSLCFQMAWKNPPTDSDDGRESRVTSARERLRLPIDEPKISAASVIRVGDGRGFVIEHVVSIPLLRKLLRVKGLRQRRFREHRVVITAGHCLPRFPRAHTASCTEERTYANLLGRIKDQRRQCLGRVPDRTTPPLRD